MKGLDHAWHVALNRYNAGTKPFRYWMYESKRLCNETPRLKRLFELERTGALPQTHKQCSLQPTEPIEDNHLRCCLGVKCQECPHLQALDGLNEAFVDEAKAWTCAGHIVHQCSKQRVDTSEGYILTVGDRMFWDRVYTSLSQNPEAD
jgi:hypothetical protein